MKIDELKEILSPLDFAYWQLGQRVAMQRMLRDTQAPELLLDNEARLVEKWTLEAVRLLQEDLDRRGS